jgi:predicted membrane metal-binding protein
MDFSSSVSWLLGFICGTLFGLHTDFFCRYWQPYFAFLFFLLGVRVLINSRRFLIKSQVFFCLGILWGAFHSAPIPQHDLIHAQVVHKNLIPLGSGLIVKTLNSLTNQTEYYFVYGDANLGERGETVYFKKQSAFPPDYSHFKRSITTRSENVLSRFMDAFERQIEVASLGVRSFIKSIVLGDTQDLGSDLLEAFSKLGLFHLLVVSGLHISYLSLLVLKLLSFPIHCLYSVCLINPAFWFFLRRVLQFVSVVVVLIFAIFLGFPPSVQRAVFLFSFDQVSKIFAISCSQKHRVAHVLVLQSVFFAFDLFSIGSLLSWLSYLTVFGFAQIKQKNWKDAALCQLALCLYVAAILGQLSLVGFFANILVLPLFPFVALWVIPILARSVFPESFVEIGLVVQELFLILLRESSKLVDEVSCLYFQISSLAWLRLGLFFTACICSLSLIGKSGDTDLRNG